MKAKEALAEKTAVEEIQDIAERLCNQLLAEENYLLRLGEKCCLHRFGYYLDKTDWDVQAAKDAIEKTIEEAIELRNAMQKIKKIAHLV
jgi:predicted transcriptional regulator of viral defense system